MRTVSNRNVFRERSFYPRDACIARSVPSSGVCSLYRLCLSQSHSLRYCVKTAEPIIEFFRRTGSPISLVLPCRRPMGNFNGVLHKGCLQGACKTKNSGRGLLFPDPIASREGKPVPTPHNVNRICISPGRTNNSFFGTFGSPIMGPYT